MLLFAVQNAAVQQSFPEIKMANKIKDFVNEQAQVLAAQAGKLREKPVEAVRGATARSADRIRALREPVRVVARSGVKLTAISHGTAQSLIELQAQLVTSALDDAAAQLERAARTETPLELVRDQAEVLRATRERIVKDFGQAVAILKDAGGDVRKVAKQTYASMTGVEKAKPAAKAKRARKTARPARKTAARKK